MVRLASAAGKVVRISLDMDLMRYPLKVEKRTLLSRQAEGRKRPSRRTRRRHVSYSPKIAHSPKRSFAAPGATGTHREVYSKANEIGIEGDKRSKGTMTLVFDCASSQDSCAEPFLPPGHLTRHHFAGLPGMISRSQCTCAEFGRCSRVATSLQERLQPRCPYSQLAKEH
jgi:hypothetical protein